MEARQQQHPTSSTGERAPTAADKVFNVPELVENILINLLPLDLVTLRALNRATRNTIDESPTLQRNLFLRKSNGVEAVRPSPGPGDFKFALRVGEFGDPHGLARKGESSTSNTVTSWSAGHCLQINELLFECSESTIVCGYDGAIPFPYPRHINFKIHPKVFKSATNKSGTYSTKLCGNMFITSPPTTTLDLCITSDVRNLRIPRINIINISGVTFNDVLAGLDRIPAAVWKKGPFTWKTAQNLSLSFEYDNSQSTIPEFAFFTTNETRKILDGYEKPVLWSVIESRTSRLQCTWQKVEGG